MFREKIVGSVNGGAYRDDQLFIKKNEIHPEKTYESQNEASTKLDYLIKNKKISLSVTFVFVAILMAGIIMLLYFTQVRGTSKQDKSEETNNNDNPEATASYTFSNLSKLDGCQIREEEDWGIKRNLEDIELRHPVPLVIISHSATPFCNSTTACKERMKQMQEYHISKGSPDIGYNFVVGGDGNVYVGRGWNARNFHLGNHSIGINFVGNFFRDELTPKMIGCAKAIMAYGLKTKKLEDDYKIVCHNQTNSNVLSPGPNVYAEVKKWPRFMEGVVGWNYLYGV